ncbi:receptor kinase-like protein Xa21 [Lolium rigidum]|uniref:receptor kinase-like protein Xa21 n=1 Tax=Lolium rigidum TaxID=89674 RepID=UPI001F5C6F8D|nr:receptor kinase-like protein Xa21 [Lolium rigidum]
MQERLQFRWIRPSKGDGGFMFASQPARYTMLLLLAPLLISYGVGNAHCSIVHDNSTDILSLLDFKRAITNNPRQALSSWNISIPHCQWEGVNCSLTHPGRVTVVNLRNLGLSGPISPSLGNLTFLEILDLSTNRFTGELPPLNSLHRLQELVLLDNLLHGIIPDTLTNCSKLQKIFLYRNHLVGEIPPNIGLLSNLLVLELSGNNLTGAIPPSLKNISQLKAIYLSDNELTGTIPDELGQLPNLSALSLSGNRLSGGIPETLYKNNQSFLRALDLGFNMLGTSLPSNFGDSLPSLIDLLLGYNNFEGHIPASMGNISQLGALDLSSNYFSGQIPSSLGRLGMLNFLNLGGNQLEAKDMGNWEFITALSNCSSLQVLGLGGNKLQGPIPNSIGKLSSELQQLDLDTNELSGSVPINTGNLVGLTLLDLSNNRLDGPIEGWVGKLKELTVLILEGNSFTGPIPSSIGNLTYLTTISLAENEFEGPIPPSMGNLAMLTKLNLSHNGLQGSIPREVFQTTSALTECVLSYNNLHGTIPTEVGSLKQLVVLHLSCNKLSGEVPGALGESQELQIILLDQNNLTGIIPQSLSNLKSLVVLNISHNDLSGSIPTSLGDMQFLKQLDLSYNQIHGEIPGNGIFENATAVSLNGNWGLCGGAVNLHMPTCPTISLRKGRKYYLVRALVPLFCFASLAMLIYFVLMVGNTPRTPYLMLLSFGKHFPRVSYKDLAQATQRFSESNLIGRGSYGSVYRGKLTQAKIEVAIKVFDLDVRCADKSFISECDALSSIRHRNLISILTACSTIDNVGNAFKAVIYEFMPNGNLDTWLHTKSAVEVKKSLGLGQRISMAVNIADALAYIHHDITRSIVHCDLKPSNILLDADMNAYLGDFGISNLIRDSESASVGHSSSASTSESSTRLKGTIGYIAPEYAQTSQASTCGDVYSFGIVLLEMLIGKRPTDPMFDNELNIVTFTERNSPDQILHIIDSHLQEECKEFICARAEEGNVVYHQCLVSFVQVALSCTRLFPRERINMREVSMKLHAARTSYVRATTRVHDKTR